MLPIRAKPNAPRLPDRTSQAIENERLTNDIVKALKTVYDPEIPADIYELGLIYRVDIAEEGFVEIDMTLTAPGCPVAGEMPVWVKNAVERCAWRQRGEGEHGVRSALGSKPHVG